MAPWESTHTQVEPAESTVVGGDLQIEALEAVRVVAAEYGIPTGVLKPCIAFLLDGNVTGSLRSSAFTLAIELRGQGRKQEETETLLEQWARKVGFSHRDVTRAVKSAFQKKADGEYRYHPPGLQKRAGTVYAEVLAPVCEEIGCPANCPAFSKKYAGLPSETFTRFIERGWARELKGRRWNRAVDVYMAICVREKQLGFAPGVELLTTYKQLAHLADGTHYTSVGDSLARLASLGLVEFEPGSGDGPNARNRKPSRVMRVVPIPPLPGKSSRSSSAFNTGGERRPQIGSQSQLGPSAGNAQARREVAP